MILHILFFIIWIYILWVTKRAKLDFFKFCIGSVGLFVFMMIWLQPVATLPLTKIVAAGTGILGKITKMYESYYEYGMIFITQNDSSISLYIDYECSGIIEIMAFSSMLWFFPVYNFFEKFIITIGGIVWIFMANVFRIFVICTMIFFFGNNVFYLAHTVFGRIIFYVLSVILYFYVFTKSQVIRQKVGNFNYGDDI